jgi:hypothetical protein
MAKVCVRETTSRKMVSFIMRPIFDFRAYLSPKNLELLDFFIVL